LDNVKIAVRFTVLAFVLVAGALSFAGLDPASKAEAEALATDKPAVDKPYNGSNDKPYISSKKDENSTQDRMQTGAGNTG
jgi:hypothetical protein